MSIADREQTAPSDRERLVEAMARGCARWGYAETEVQAVLTEAYVSRQAFDRLFGSKEACALAAVEAILGEGMATVSAGYSADTSEWESALQALRALLELFAARPAMADLAFVHSRQMMPAAALSHYESGFAILTAMLDRLRSGSDEQGPPLSAARAAIGGGEALVRREIFGGRAADLPKALPDLVFGATVPFLGAREALRLARQGRRLLEGSAWE